MMPHPLVFLYQEVNGINMKMHDLARLITDTLESIVKYAQLQFCKKVFFFPQNKVISIALCIAVCSNTLKTDLSKTILQGPKYLLAEF